MKIIGINGSPRKNGITRTLVQAVLDGAKEKGYETSVFNLNEMKFSGCQACLYCKSHDHCSQNDDATGLLRAIEDADAVVFSTPIYFGQPTGQFRLFQDRMYSFVGPEFRITLPPNKKAITVVSQGSPDAGMFTSTTDALNNFVTMFGFSLVDTISMINGNDPSSLRDRKDLLDKAYLAGKSL